MSRVNAGRGKFVTQSQAQFVLDNAAWSDQELADELGIPTTKVRQVRRAQLWAKLSARPGYALPTPAAVARQVAAAPAAPRRRQAHSTAYGLPTVTTDEPFIGFRMWYVSGVDGKPRATAHNEFVWSKSLTAVCLDNSGHVAPEDACECGIHANNSIREMEDRMASYEGTAAFSVVVAAVRLTGKVIEAEAGFRAQKAEVIAVSTPIVKSLPNLKADDLITATVAFNLDVPKVPYSTLAAYAAEFGQLRHPADTEAKAQRIVDHVQADRTLPTKGSGPIRCSCGDRFPDTDAMLDHRNLDHQEAK